MSIKLVVVGRPPLELEDEYITLGRDPVCIVAFPEVADLELKHAVLHLVTGKWLIEAKQSATFCVGGGKPQQVHWLASGDEIRLSEKSPTITIHFAPAEVKARTVVNLVPPVAEQSPPVAPLSDPTDDLPLRLASEKDRRSVSAKPAVRDSDPIIPVMPSTATKGTTAFKPLSSAIIPVVKPTLEGQKPCAPKVPKPAGAPSETNIPVLPAANAGSDQLKPPSSKTIRTTKAPGSTELPTAKPEKTAGPGTKAPSSTTIRTTKPPSSTTIRTTKPPSSGTIKTRVPLSDDEIPASDLAKPSVKSKNLNSASDDNDPAARVPVLKRLSSWEMPIPGSDLTDEIDGLESSYSPKRHKFGDDADIRFVKSVVIRCVAALLAGIILFQGCRELFKAMSGPRIDAPATSMNSQ